MSLKRTTWMDHVVVKATAVVISFVSNAALGQGVNTVVGWGYNGFGQCSPPANLGPCLQVAGGGNQTAALQSSGAVIAWGLNAQGQCNVPKNLGACLQVAAGTNHTAAISNSGIVVVWGDNSLGQCGTSTERVGGRPGNSNSVNGAFWVKTNSVGPCTTIAAGANHTLAIKRNGIVVAWGYNIYGQCGVSGENTGPYGIWTKAALGACTQVAGGSNFSAALKSNGLIATWGYNGSGQCGPANERVVSSSAYWLRKSIGICVQVSAGGEFALAVKQNGTVVAWGANTYGQCNVPQTITNCIQTAAGNDNSLALLSNGMVMAWGMNTSGQSNVPSTLGSCVQIAAGDYNSLAIQGTLPASNLVASDGAFGNRVQVQWNATANAQSYFVFRAVGGGAAIHIGTCSVPNYSDTTAVAGTRYTYSVRVSSNASGLSIASNSDFGWKR